MKLFRKAITVLLLAALPVLASAQQTKIPQRLELIEIETDGNGTVENFEVFNMPKDGVNQYFLSVGHLGFGDEIIQIQFDPLYELFIPLGNTVTEALASLKEMQKLFKAPKGTSMEVEGSLALAFPNDNREPVTVTHRRFLLTRMLEFSVQREGYIRAAHLNKSDFNALVNGVKLYGKLHPKER